MKKIDKIYVFKYNIKLMANYTINLIHQISSLTESINESKSSGFLFKYNNINYVITVHHYLPIIKTILDTTSETVELKKFKTINWNELNIFESPEEKFLLNTKIIKSYRTRFPEIKSIMKMEINNKFERYECYDYYTWCVNPLSKLRSMYIKFFIGCVNEEQRVNIINKYQGLSGKPVFDSDDKLIGIFCKSIFENNTESKDRTSYNVYGLVLPTIYLIKSLSKKDNESVYYLDINDFDLKLGKFEIQKENNFEFSIYYLPINYKIPLDIYVNLEGDEDTKIMSKNTKTLSSKILKFIKNENFDFKLKLEKNASGDYKLNTGFISTLIKGGYKKQAFDICTKYKDYREPINNIYITLSDLFESLSL